MIRKRWFVKWAMLELFEFCETIPKVQCSECFLLELRSDLLHLWTSLGWQRIQPTFSPMATGCFLNRELRHQEGATLWSSARQNWGTERAFRGPQRAEEMYQQEIWWNSRSLSQRFNISWFCVSKIGWTEEKCIPMDWLAQEDHSCYPSSEECERYRKTGLSHWTKQAEMHRWKTPIRLPNSSHNYKTVSTEDLEKNDLNQFSFISPKGGIRRLLFPAHLGGSGMNIGGAHNFSFVVARSFTADGNLLQPTGVWTERPSHVTFSCVSPHSF